VSTEQVVGTIPAHLASATVVLRWSDGKTQTFDFDTLDQGIGLEYYVAVDVRDKTGADSQWREVDAGDRRRMRFEIGGRGPMPGAEL
jgi:hypothetical protein